MIEAEKEYLKFEESVIKIIRNSIELYGLSKTNKLEVITNYKFRTIDRQSYLVDILITNDKQPILVICVKYFPNEINYSLINFEFKRLHKQAEILRAPYYLIISNKGYQFGNRQNSLSNDADFCKGDDLEKSICEILKNSQFLSYNSVSADQNEGFLTYFIKYFEGVIDVISSSTNNTERSIQDIRDKFLPYLKLDSFEIGPTSISFSHQIETDFFKTLLGNCKKHIFRYTSLPSFFRTCDEKRQGMASIVCMNDRSEIYYFNTYIQDQLSQNKSYNQAYILSFTTKRDDLTMFRLYGADCAGVCIEYQNDLSQNELEKLNFYLAPVCYSKQDGKHPELDLIKELLKFSHKGRSFSFRQLDYWQYFFKHYDYRVEDEIRLLYLKPEPEQDSTSRHKREESLISEQWILDGNYGIVSPIAFFDITEGSKVFPLTIKEIILGNKLKESELNIGQIQQLMEIKKIKRIADFTVKPSNINNYR